MTDLAELVRELASDLAEHWRDPYWWADHPALRTAGICLIAGLIGLAVEYGKLRMTQTMMGAPT